ncbi:bifunctional nicotinamidase/pyrazinamidase [Neisseriaceae bacterium TC5R-5]|nr:bifunctional nicotinamidase/pyrazinamidase [Neisseriaceae bacterium TC5R-5]
MPLHAYPADCALIVIDVQNSFCPGGELAVKDGDAVVPLINQLMPAFQQVVLTQDWHPADHISFAGNHVSKTPFASITLPYGEQTLWPEHCVAGSHGADFHAGLNTDYAQLIIRKGHHRAVDSYSAFVEADGQTLTGLAAYLAARGIKRIWLVGLATDFCVAWSALDARKVRLETTVITDACRAIDLNGSLAAATAQMQAAGVHLQTLGELQSGA